MFHWFDRKVAPDTIRRTYFGWAKSRPKNDKASHQPLHFMNGVEVCEYGEEVLSCLPSLFQQFVARSQLFDFGLALHPLWTALGGVLQDRLALASVSLERTVSMWDGCRQKVLKGEPASNSSVWRDKSLSRSIRKSLIRKLNKVLGIDGREKGCCRRAIDAVITHVEWFITKNSCRSLSDEEKHELSKVLIARINNLTAIPNSARLRRPFEDLSIPLTEEEKEAIRQRNSALHGRQEDNASTTDRLDLSVEYFGRLRMLITKFVLGLCGYKGPYIDYASRPADGNFKVKRLSHPD